MVAGDSRGTASTLVGLTPEEELELAMLKSRVAEEEPHEPPLTLTLTLSLSLTLSLTRTRTRTRTLTLTLTVTQPSLP